jgi:putative transposase
VLSLSKIGRIPLRLHRPLEGTPKTVTVRREAAGWYVCFSCAEVPTQPLPPTARETGIDRGLKVLLLTAEGEVVETPRHSPKAEKQLAKAQRRLSRRKQGSTRRKTAVKLLARKHQQVRRQRSDHHHKTALALLRVYDTLSLEELRGANLVRNRHLAKSISEVGWAAFGTILEAKAAGAGRRASGYSRATGLYQPGLQRLWGARAYVPTCLRAYVPTCLRAYELERAPPRLPLLWTHPGPRRKRGPQHSIGRTTMGRAGPSGTRGAPCGAEPRSPCL